MTIAGQRLLVEQHVQGSDDERELYWQASYTWGEHSRSASATETFNDEDRVLTDGQLIHGWFVQGPFFFKG